MLQHTHEQNIRGLKGAIQITDNGTEGGVLTTLFFVDDQGDILTFTFTLKVTALELWITNFKVPNELLVRTVYKDDGSKGVSFWFHNNQLSIIPHYRDLSISERWKIYNPELLLSREHMLQVSDMLDTIIAQNTLTETR